MSQTTQHSTILSNTFKCLTRKTTALWAICLLCSTEAFASGALASSSSGSWTLKELHARSETVFSAFFGFLGAVAALVGFILAFKSLSNIWQISQGKAQGSSAGNWLGLLVAIMMGGLSYWFFSMVMITTR